MQTFESKLRNDLNWALDEAGRYFQGCGSVHDTVRRVAHHLDMQHIPYAVAGDVAMFFHGFRQFTSKVEILLTSKGIDALQPEIMEDCHVISANALHLRDRASGVLVEVSLAGQFPGDGKPKPIAFPDPSNASLDIGGIQYLQLEKLIELKLSSGMTNLGRLKDLADVQGLIRVLKLDAEFAERLDPYVRPKFAELWRAVADDTGSSDLE
jgi:hypothetical protein